MYINKKDSEVPFWIFYEQKKEEKNGDKAHDRQKEDEQKPKSTERDVPEHAMEEKKDENTTLNSRNQLSEDSDKRDKEKQESLSFKSGSETHKDDKKHNERTDDGKAPIIENENCKNTENAVETS